MANEELRALRILYPGKSYGVAMRLWTIAYNQKSWRVKNLLTPGESYNHEEDAFWQAAVTVDGFLMMENGTDALLLENGIDKVLL